MSVTVQDQGRLRRIEVLGSMAQPADHAALAEALRPDGWEAAELSVYDARTLPRSVVLVLHEALAAGRELKIHAYHGYLGHFLMRLGLPVRTVPSRSLRPVGPETRALVLGGSAQSLDKILYVVERLPPSEAAVFVVQHVLEDQENLLDQLLRVRTDYRVIMPQQLMPVEPGTIYVAPPAHQMKVAHGRVYLTRDRRINFARPSIDALLESVAWEYGDSALAVLLCGYGSDGVAGLRTLSDKGGTTVVEESGECGDARQLPDRARESSPHHYRLILEEIAAFTAAALAGRGRRLPEPPLIEHFLAAAFARYGYDFRGYQRGTVERRLEKIVGLLDVGDFFGLVREVVSDPEVFERFFLEMSVNVSAFFRHPQQFRYLRDHLLPYLDSFPHIKVWSAGCSGGEEIYSLAALLDELGMLEKAQMFATDINRHVLDEARTGLFPRKCVEEDRENYLQAGGRAGLGAFLDDNGRFLGVHERLRRRILFHHHSLAHDGVFNEFQLILCRNVLIYFHHDLQRRVMDLFARSLHRDGFLILGPSEGLSGGAGERYFKPVPGGDGHIYRWK